MRKKKIFTEDSHENSCEADSLGKLHFFVCVCVSNCLFCLLVFLFCFVLFFCFIGKKMIFTTYGGKVFFPIYIKEKKHFFQYCVKFNLIQM